MDLDVFRQKAQTQRKNNQQFIKKLKRLKPKDLDRQFHEQHEEAFEQIDCLTCANCCKTTSPIFTDKDIGRLAKHLRMRPAAFIEQYLYLDNEQHYVLHSAPCPFLGADNYCAVYEARPRACREYPHTNRKKMEQILTLTYRNTQVCPAVLKIVEALKEVY